MTVLTRWQKADTKNGAGFLPAVGTLLPNPNGRISPSLYTGEPNTNDYVKTVASIGYDFRHDFGAGTVFRQNVRFRSEEHTSELQSLMRISYAVFCLKKKKNT